MKTSLTELRLIETYLLSKDKGADSSLLEAKLILQPALEEEIYWQQKTYEIVNDFGRAQLKKEIEKVHETLFTTSKYRSFRAQIMRLFIK